MIKLVEDVVVPGAVVAADLVSEAMMPKYNEWLAYILFGGGYIASAMGLGGDVTKNAGIASADWAIKALKARLTTKSGSSAMAYRASRPAAMSSIATTKPEFGNVVNY